MPRRRAEIDDGLDSSDDSENEMLEILDPLLQEEAQLFKDPSRYHKRRKFTQEEAYLGIWADREDEDDVRSGRRKGDVQFVASTSKSIQSTSIEDDDLDDIDKKDSIVISDDSFEGYSDDEKDMSRSGLHREKIHAVKPPLENPWKKPSVIDRDFGKFEQHTKGIGLKLMQKMGYKIGEGLGVEGHGITKPIETKLRPQKMGLAYRGFDEKTEQARKNAKRQDSDEEENLIKQVPKVKKNAWKKSTKSKKINIEYKTADEIMNEAASITPVRPMKIIDMTGPQTRELSSASQITSLTIPDSSTRLPELRHNLRLIVDMSKADLEHFTREKRIQNERTKALKRDVDRVTALIEDEAGRINRLNDIMSIVNECNRLLTLAISSNSPSLQLFMEPFEKLQTKYQDEYELYELDTAVIAIVAPVFKQYMTFWDPLENPQLGLQEFQKWKGLLKTTKMMLSENDHLRELSMTPYESMMYNIWLPKVRSAINNTWSARDFDPAIRLLESWRPPLLPVFIYENIKNQLIMPKLTREVDAWNPKTDNEMIHQWLHPWLPVLGELMDPLYVTIRQKFRVILQNWDPMDTKAMAILLPHPSQRSEIPIPDSEQFFSSTKPTPIIDDAEITFKEIIEEFAEEENLLFLPTNKNHKISGKPLYRLGRTQGAGGLTLYLDDDVMYVKQGLEWLPMGFDEVLEKLT
ncbi:TFP11-domain-containing protein [Gigaspora margarita]|uniref:TFP11-domain-containing protein n=1 Tax=Gigaspora margarita TaxID=4874 RepID=A0A8H3X0B5_GIGMA|nr:TFP11-domain-containing protein [Gigaspora margarita]